MGLFVLFSYKKYPSIDPVALFLVASSRNGGETSQNIY